MSKTNELACPSRSRPAIRVRRKILYLAILIGSVVILCEGALRLRAWIKYGDAGSLSDSLMMRDAELGMNLPRPGAEIKGRNVWIKVNSLGFRGAEFTREKPRDTIRIACLGASTTFCGEVSSNEATWPAQLERMLQKRYPKVRIQVINAGVGGYIAADCLKNLRLRVLPLQPDLVIYYEANNELAHDTRHLAQSRGLIKENENNISPVARFLSKYSLLFSLVHKNLKILAARGDHKAGTLDSIPRDLPEQFISELDQMHQELAQRKIPLVLSSYLVKYRRDQERSVQLANADVAFYYMPWMSMNDLLDGMDYYNEAIVGYAHAKGIPVAEESNSIPADAKHFADCMHLTDAGCTKMAERFAGFLASKHVIDALIRQRGLARPPAL